MRLLSGVREDENVTLVALAWRRYLAAVRGADSETYDGVEERAWARLYEELTRLGRPLPLVGSAAGRPEEP